MSSPEAPPRLRRYASVLAGVAMAALLVSSLASRKDPEPTERPTAERRRAVVEPTSEVPAEVAAAPEPVEEVPVELPLAMDLTLARDQVARLRMAAASGDATTCASARGGLARMGRLARPALDEALRTEADPHVRAELQQARAGLR